MVRVIALGLDFFVCEMGLMIPASSILRITRANAGAWNGSSRLLGSGEGAVEAAEWGGHEKSLSRRRLWPEVRALWQGGFKGQDPGPLHVL